MSDMSSVIVGESQQLAQAPLELQQLAQAPAQLQLMAQAPLQLQQVTQQQVKAQGGGPIRARQHKSNHGFNKLLPNRPKKANSPYTMFIKGYYERNRHSNVSTRNLSLTEA